MHQVDSAYTYISHYTVLYLQVMKFKPQLKEFFDAHHLRSDFHEQVKFVRNTIQCFIRGYMGAPPQQEFPAPILHSNVGGLSHVVCCWVSKALVLLLGSLASCKRIYCWYLSYVPSLVLAIVLLIR